MPDLSPTLELATQLIAKPSVTPDDCDCQNIMIERLAAIGFEVERLPFGHSPRAWENDIPTAAIMIVGKENTAMCRCFHHTCDDVLCLNKMQFQPQCLSMELREQRSSFRRFFGAPTLKDGWKDVRLYGTSTAKDWSEI